MVFQVLGVGSRVFAFVERAGLKISLPRDRPRMAYVYSVFHPFRARRFSWRHFRISVPARRRALEYDGFPGARGRVARARRGAEILARAPPAGGIRVQRFQ